MWTISTTCTGRLGDYKAGDTVTVGYVRKGARRSSTVTVDEESNPKVYRFRSHAAPEFDFDFDLEGLREEGIRMKEHQKQIQQELKRVQEEVKKKGAEAKREAERAAQEVKRVMRKRTI